jgi:hypothetical protein
MNIKYYYRVLGVSSDATLRDIKAAYRRHALKLHPDINPGDKSAEEQFLLVQEAYAVLSDPEERRKYDSSLYDAEDFRRRQQPSIPHYFHVSVSQNVLRVNSEFYLTYRYIGSGRNFVRPPLKEFFLASKPLVSFRKVNAGGTIVRETAITFVLYPLFKGEHTIAPATIRLDDVPFTSTSLSVEVTDNICYYNPKELADGNPYRIRLRGEFTEQTVVIARSKRTAALHAAGAVLKIAGAATGLSFGIYSDKFIFLGMALGSILGGLACLALYSVTGIRPKHYHALRHPQVEHYFDKGYYDALLGDAGKAGGGIVPYLVRVIS